MNTMTNGRKHSRKTSTGSPDRRYRSNQDQSQWVVVNGRNRAYPYGVKLDANQNMDDSISFLAKSLRGAVSLADSLNIRDGYPRLDEEQKDIKLRIRK